MKYLILILIVVLVSGQKDDYWNMDVQQRSEDLGFGYEEYQVTTDDGYILTLMRIPSGPQSPQQEGKQPILLAHPLFEAGEAFTRLGSVYSPAFYLADEGKDVWLFNMRGTTFSRQHVNLDPSTDDEYWDFYMDTIRYDYMACIQFILDNTGFSSIPVFAMSFGGATFAISLALEPEFFSSRVSVAVLAAPALNMGHTNALIYALLGNFPNILETLRSGGMNVFRDDNQMMRNLLYTAARLFGPIVQGIGGTVLGEGDPFALDPEGMSILLARSQYGVGMRALQHLFQSVRLNDLTYFDYGPRGNFDVYGTETPPEIPLEDINVPVALMFGEFDNVVPEEDQQWIRERMGDNIIFDQVYEGFSHLSFLIGDNIEVYLEDLTDITEEYPAVIGDEN
ncbi:unnamed protein product [Moneuplotes crassus]|uniref:Lipase n=1 Tax=Euplotes crassus TaxID=5936 RepID=A0AAD1ULA7_EUPCR|nr:unnamed protein product [Moneuplotes crassus]